VGNHAMEQGLYELDEVNIIKKCLKKTDIFINIGANMGYYCCIALQEEKHTIAFEPIESNLMCLYRNVKANHWEKNVEIFPIALSNHTGLIEIYGAGAVASLVQGWGRLPEQYKRLVPVSTLDTVLDNRFVGKKCLILVDIEGAEDYMLESAKKFLALEPKPIWMVEIAVTEHQPTGTNLNPHLLSTFQRFWENGYEAWSADKHLKFITEEEVKKICGSGNDTFLTHNFLFIEKDKKDEIMG